MHICSAYIALGGDTNNVVFRGPDNPVTWPEVGMLQFLHGEENVYNIEVIGERDERGATEKQRLSDIYGAGIVDQIYPGKNPVMEMEMPGVSLKDKTGSKRKAPKGAVTITSLADEDEAEAKTEEI